jgi:cysteine desulfurase
VHQVYFDHAATTAPRPEVVEAMLSYLQQRWGNPSSLHDTGVAALEGVERAREQVAELIGADPDEIVFTGSGTEADNHALIGAAIAWRARGDHIITSAIEHHAVLHTAEFLGQFGVRITYLPVASSGVVDPGAVQEAITPRTILVSIMHGNNEIGSLQPIAEIGALCRERGVLFHTDAVQTVGHLSVSVHEMHVDLLSLSAHKLYGPKGVGALFLRKGVKLAPFIHGGRQEGGRRASTENVPGIVGLGEAARLARQELGSAAQHDAELRNLLIAGALDSIPGVALTGHPTRRLPNNASFCFQGVDGESLVLALNAEGFAVSSGSACSSGQTQPSHVLLALGIALDVAGGSLRVSVGRDNTREDVERFLAVLPGIVAGLRDRSASLLRAI